LHPSAYFQGSDLLIRYLFKGFFHPQGMTQSSFIKVQWCWLARG
jgi:hypothetical protein